MEIEIINTENPSRIDWDMAMEATATILNEIVAWAGRESLIERQKPQPDLQRLEQLATWRAHALRDNHPGNFRELPVMIAIIEKYSEVINRNF